MGYIELNIPHSIIYIFLTDLFATNVTLVEKIYCISTEREPCVFVLIVNKKRIYNFMHSFFISSVVILVCKLLKNMQGKGVEPLDVSINKSFPKKCNISLGVMFRCKRTFFIFLIILIFVKH